MEIELKQFQERETDLYNAAYRSRLSAQSRYHLFKKFDPYPAIPPSLLNAGHPASYTHAIGMIDPFEADKLIKPATYSVAVEGPVRYMDEKGKVERFFLTKDLTKQFHNPPVRDHVRLAPNSICFLTLNPIFRMPSYIGVRFKLVISYVYKDLLVGTGPLVDPGFCGQLSIPIHNLTNNEYYIDAGDELVYFEFTKISWCNPLETGPTSLWLPPSLNDQPPFPSSKNKRRNLDDYLKAATGGGPPQSAIGVEITNMRAQVSKIETLFRVFTFSASSQRLLFCTPHGKSTLVRSNLLKPLKRSCETQT
jgi:deoxycytidine triphosphate deaminase